MVVEVDRALAHEQPRPLRLGEAVDVVHEPTNAVRVALDLGERHVRVGDEAVAQRLDAAEHAGERAAELVRHVVDRRPPELVLVAEREGQPVDGVREARDLAPAAEPGRPRLHLARAEPPRDLGQPLERPGEVERDEQREGQRERPGDDSGLDQQAAHPVLEMAVEALGGAVDPAPCAPDGR